MKGNNMNCKDYAKMIYFEATDLMEQIEQCEYQSEASLLRKHCLKMRHDLNELYKKLGKFDKDE